MPVTALIRGRQFALGFELETPRLQSGPGSLPVSWAWALPFPLSLNFLICEMGEITLTLQGYGGD